MAERRTAIAARRFRLKDLPAPVFRWPPFLVTAAHGMVMDAASEHARMPRGTWHARQVGSLQTACGSSAVNWQYFWTLDFNDAGTQKCPECARVVSGWSRRPEGPRQPGRGETRGEDRHGAPV